MRLLHARGQSACGVQRGGSPDGALMSARDARLSSWRAAADHQATDSDRPFTRPQSAPSRNAMARAIPMTRAGANHSQQPTRRQPLGLPATQRSLLLRCLLLRSAGLLRLAPCHIAPPRALVSGGIRPILGEVNTTSWPLMRTHPFSGSTRGPDSLGGWQTAEAEAVPSEKHRQPALDALADRQHREAPDTPVRWAAPLAEVGALLPGARPWRDHRRKPVDDGGQRARHSDLQFLAGQVRLRSCPRDERTARIPPAAALIQPPPWVPLETLRPRAPAAESARRATPSSPAPPS